MNRSFRLSCRSWSVRESIPSPSRGGPGWGWGAPRISHIPIPLPASPLKGEERIVSVARLGESLDRVSL